MTTLAAEILESNVAPNIVSAAVTNDILIHAPVAQYPRLLHGNRKERENWRLISRGHGIHWEDLDEDISLDNLMMGRPSNESRASLERWLDARKTDSARM
uniref:DUF2442 domain-containing protein n=1 Tax=Candidatus Kentrum sp. TC TaxID=2126339 RepID=A0A450ZTR6_9GAMM|nr:MAG: Protein of unknown function (DUF2442) [Candidatus Kentron sp. TC]VFK42787.1 MAG: Protein of unknown function (DUF2442) [Candidatus Kentron sp. TC]VFK57186.1 MAG: Protein of unknown function (DUF2442) [Candidatus Kentron sp. TC]